MGRKMLSSISVFIMVLGLAVILGWTFNIGILKSVIPGYDSMKFNAAFALVISGLIFYFTIRLKFKVLQTTLTYILILLSGAS